VKAENEEGESEPVETDVATLAKNPYEEPGAPGVPTFKDWDVDSADLEWTKPKSDGNC